MYKQYQQPDPFYYQGTLSQLVSTQSVEGEQLWDLKNHGDKNHGDRTNDTLNQTKYPRP